MTIQRLEYLLNQAESNLISGPESQELTAWYRSFFREEGFTSTLSPERLDQLEKWMWSRIHSAVMPILPLPGQPDADLRLEGAMHKLPGRRTLYLRWSAAAAILLLLGAGAYFQLRPLKHRPAIAATSQGITHDAEPGGNRATLTLGDGSIISLDTARNGILSQTAGISVAKQTAGRLVYRTDNGSKPGSLPKMLYNTLSTPRGGQYQVVLPDGTHVWMNAASTLRYPGRFPGNTRTVELDGEAYFEVAKDPDRPFIVHTQDMDIRVLGTHFDVMAYEDDRKFATTLLEGSVNVSHGALQERLDPGQQAVIREGASQLQVSGADVEQAIAWKNGLFQFNDADLPTILRQAARWYDINIVYGGQVPTDLFRGKISRNVQLSKLLKVLELNGVHFTITGKTLTVH